MELLQQEFDGESEEINADKSLWKEFNTGDTKFNKFIQVGNTGYKPPQGEHLNTLQSFFHYFLMIS